MTRALILLAHGSKDPLWAQAIVNLRALLTQQGLLVRCAYLESMQPNLSEAVDELMREAISAIDIFPVFMGVGQHLRQDLPAKVQAVQQTYPALALRLLPALGENHAMLTAIAQALTAQLADPHAKPFSDSRT